MLRKVQYVWKDHTMIRAKSWERISVDENEIIEVEVEREIDLKYYTLNWFKVVLSEEEEEEIKEKEKKAKAEAKAKEKADAEAKEDANTTDTDPEASDTPVDIEALKAEAIALGIVVKDNWGVKALTKHIENKKAEAEAE